MSAHPDTSAAHRAEAPASVPAFVVTCSDTRTAERDTGGQLVRARLVAAGHRVLGARIVPDDVQALHQALDEAAALGARTVIVTGGTGLSPRDVTVEALAPRFERLIPGFGELFRLLSFEQVGSAAMLSRAVAGIIRGAVVFALPGSPRAVELAMDRLVLPELGHLVRELDRPAAP